jgi:hypothetical protein
MKSTVRIFLISFLIATSFIIAGCASNDNKQPHSGDDSHGIIVEANHRLVTMRVPQIPCDDCKAKVEAVLKTEGAIVRFQVFKTAERTQNVLIVYDPQKIQLDEIKALITKLNKTVENVTDN